MIDAVVFDVGRTLRKRGSIDPAVGRQRLQKVMELVGAEGTPEEFAQMLAEREQKYKDWAEATLFELSEKDIWTRWMLPEYPEELVSRLALELDQNYRDSMGEKRVFPETKEVLLELFRRGYRLGLVSNTSSSVEAPTMLKNIGLDKYFDTIILSCLAGKRKPDPALLLQASQDIGVEPEHCVYIGDHPARDMACARQAGYGMGIILWDPDQAEMVEMEIKNDPSLAPDHMIYNLKELLELFPEKNGRSPKKAQRRSEQRRKDQPYMYQASLSTMWAIGNFEHMNDFIEMSRRLGFSGIELNHAVDSAMLEGVHWDHQQVSSVHEPCPADVSVHMQKDRDWLISSENEENRRQGVIATQRSIDLAVKLGSKAVVVHSGTVRSDYPLEAQLYKMYKAGDHGSSAFIEKRQRLIEERAALAKPRMEAVKRSLKELVEYANPKGIRLGLENRFHYMDIPLIDEMEELLQLDSTGTLGYWYDAGHGQTLDSLGFISHEEWLKRFGKHLVGVHLHDAAGINDHQPVGMGEIDFEMVAKYIGGADVFTCEITPRATPEQLKESLRILAETGCIQAA